ncbi:MAG: diadenylate cyclase CdaA [Bacteroidales bacterium]|nr:diadenylate cyclase CdaA [Bacteroidales bacterium]
MVLALFGFLSLSSMDVLDILLVGAIIFLMFRWIRATPAMNIFLAVFAIYLLMLVVDALHMKMMSRLVSILVDVGVIAMIVIFQPEIRHFLMKMGSNTRGLRIISKLFGNKEGDMNNSSVNEICEACRRMSADKTGALIVIPHSINIQSIIETGDMIDAKISRRLIMNLFFKNSPLHDGAVIMSGDRIVAARCTLPITERQDIPANYGMRHRAAIGMTENSDADVIVVSEETGHVSFVKSGEISTIHNINELKLLLGQSMTGLGSTI